MTQLPFCKDCPDREACATGWPCGTVRATEELRVRLAAKLDRRIEEIESGR